MRKYTRYFILLSTLVILAYDAYVAFGNDEKGDTISALFGEWFGDPFGFMLPLVIGVLLGHWFWPLEDKREK